MTKKNNQNNDDHMDDDFINGDCFVIMPIADCEGYDKGHFLRVYEDIIKAACVEAKYRPVRADQVKQTNLIHLDILQKLLDSPMAICDLSSANPNVLFELGLRQAFDKPTVLIQEVGTEKIFDIAPLRYNEYRKELKYREVLEDQQVIKEAILATKEATEKGDGVNSIVNILSLAGPAIIKDVSDQDASKVLQLVRAEMSELRNDFLEVIKRIDYRNSGAYVNKKASINDAILLLEAKNLIDKVFEKDGERKGDADKIDIVNKAQSILMRITDGPAQTHIKKQAIDMLLLAQELEKKIYDSKQVGN